MRFCKLLFVTSSRLVDVLQLMWTGPIYKFLRERAVILVYLRNRQNVVNLVVKQVNVTREATFNITIRVHWVCLQAHLSDPHDPN